MTSEDYNKRKRTYNAKTQGLKRSGKKWRQEELKLILDNGLTDQELALVLQRSAHAICNMRYRITKKIHDRNININKINQLRALKRAKLGYLNDSKLEHLIL